MIRQQLTQKQQQKLSPLQIQQIKLLELNNLEIENRINQELEENPALEIDSEHTAADEDHLLPDAETSPDHEEDLTLGDYLTEDDIPDYKLQQNYSGKESSRENIPYSESESFQEFLVKQFFLKNLSEEEKQIGEYIIGNIDEDGYIRREPAAIADDLAFQYGLNVAPEKITKVLNEIQELDPPGVGASSLQDCLLIQLKRKEDSPEKEIAQTVLKNHFDAFSKKQYDKILKFLNISEEELREAIKLILLLDPKPGSAWENNMDAKMAHITPDFLVETINGELQFSMQNENIPDLKINSEYNDLLKDLSKGKEFKGKEQREAFSFIRQKVDSAQWFIEAVKQRNTTLKKTMLAIIKLQEDFFQSGDESDLKPMILKDVAEISGYDISTISRVSNSKYIQTNFGIYPLKYFFSEGIVNQEGEEVSTREIKMILKECIEKEDRTKPMTDEALGSELKKKGYAIARRTVAKYREQLNIPIARLRREL